MDSTVHQDGGVGDLAGSGSGEPQPLSEPEPPRPAPKVDDLIESLVFQLSDRVSHVYQATFPLPKPAGYARLQRLLNNYGYATVREALEWCYHMKMVPQGASAMPLLTSVCKKIGERP